MDKNTSLNKIIELEQYFIDTLHSNLNVDLVASSSGYHEPMNQKMREYLRKLKGTLLFVYNSNNFTLLFVFDSKENLYKTINMHHKTLSDCLNYGKVYL